MAESSTAIRWISRGSSSRRASLATCSTSASVKQGEPFTVAADMRLDIPQVLARDVFRSAGGRQAAMLLGAHESVAGGLDKAFAHADAHQAEAIQIFTKNANQWKEPVLGGTELAGFRAAHRAFGGRPVIAHDSYLVNLCAER